MDVEVLCSQAEGIPGVVTARRNMFMCSDPGQELILEDLKKGLVDRVVVASCSPSLHETTFRRVLERAGVNPYVYEHANIREQVSWVHHGDAATKKAYTLIAAAAAKARQLQPLEPLRVEAKRHVTVIGAGIAGMRAALDLAQRGFAVALMEKTPWTGGRAAALDRVAPTGESASELVLSLARRVLQHPSITFYGCARLVGFQGYVGNFSLDVEMTPPENADEALQKAEAAFSGTEPFFVPSKGAFIAAVPKAAKRFRIETGAIVLATGFQPYQPRRGEYGYGECAEVLTLPEFIEALRDAPAEGSVLTVRGRPFEAWP